MRHYAIPDIHGMYNVLDACFSKIEDHAKKHPDDEFEIITLGDYVDRGPDSARVIQRLMDEQKKLPLTCLRGNHEELMLDWAIGVYPLDHWAWNGGMQTLKSYKKDGGYLDKDDPHIDWVSKLPYYYETAKHVFVHAGIPDDGSLKEMNRERLTWMLYADDDPGGWGFPKEKCKHVVHGHHIHEDGPHEWDYRTALDTGSFYTNRQIIGVFNDDQGRAEEFIEVKV